VTNTLAYFGKEGIAAVKMFKSQAPSIIFYETMFLIKAICVKILVLGQLFQNFFLPD